MGGTGLEPATPSLSSWRECTRRFAWVRSEGMVERSSSDDRTDERTRTNGESYHSCHGDRLKPIRPLQRSQHSYRLANRVDEHEEERPKSELQAEDLSAQQSQLSELHECCAFAMAG